jgi:hypothetical protein
MLQVQLKVSRADAASSLRASGTVTRIKPMSRGGFSPGLAGSLPVSRQCSGWSVVPVPGPACPGPAAARGAWVPGGRDRKQCQGAYGQHGVPVEGVPQAELVLVKAGLPLPCWKYSSAGHLLPATLIRMDRHTRAGA